eukprot:scaffold1154_cov310-Pinguiococcus_pyrenoidosus.AAC.51
MQAHSGCRDRFGHADGPFSAGLRRLGQAARPFALSHRSLLLGQQTPADQRVVNEGLQKGHEGCPRLPEHDHHLLTRAPVGAFDTAHFHGVHEHPRQAERHLLRILAARGGDLEAVAKVNVNHATCVLLDHDVVEVPVTKAQDVARDRHDR